MLATSTLASDAPLRSLGRHRVLAKLGQGGMANVYLTVVQGQHGVNKLYVAKVLLADLAIDADFRSMFVKEARIATLLHHRNLVQTFEVAESEGNHYISMEYLEGRPLHALIAVVGRAAMPLDVHVGILALALAGLHSAHEQKDLTGQALDLVHRDVSPQNVFVTYDGEVKVVDFGVAKIKGGTVTETGSFFGKIGYVAPEQALSAPIDRRADIFAVGIMLWEALTRRTFVERGDGEAAALRKRLNGEIPSPREVAPDAPEELIAICERAIAYEAADRFATAAEFEEALQRYLDQQGTHIGAKQIAAVVGPPFADERARMRATVEDRLANIEALPADVGVPGEISALSGSRSRARAPAAGGARLRLLAVPGVLLALGVVGFFVTRGPSVHETPPAVVSAPQPPPSVADPKPVPKATVRARVRVSPPNAEIALDGRPLGANPFTGELPKDSATHVITATADGYVPASHDVQLDNDVDVDLALVPVPASRAATMPRPVHRDLPPAHRAVRPLDDKDPYAK